MKVSKLDSQSNSFKTKCSGGHMNSFQKLATIATILFLAACSKETEKGSNSNVSAQQAVAAITAYGMRSAELDAQKKKDAEAAAKQVADAKEVKDRDVKAKEKMFQDISSGNILEALKKTAGSNVSLMTLTLHGVESNLAYNFLDNYNVRGFETRSVASAFWFWAIENPVQLKALMDKMKTPLRLNSEFMTRLQVTEAYLKRPFSAREAKDIVSFCKAEGYD